MHVARIHTSPGRDPLEDSRFRLHQGEDWREYTVPEGWDAAAVETLLAKVFCPDPLPALTRPVPEDGVPQWLWRRAPDTAALEGLSAEWRWQPERDARDVFRRIAGGLCYHAWKAGVFGAEEDARAFHDEFLFLLLHRRAAPETALLAAAGLDWAYGLREAAFRPRARIAPFAADVPAAAMDGAGVAIARDTPQRNIMARIRILGETLALDGGQATVTLPVEHADSLAFATLKQEADTAAVARAVGLRALQDAMHRVMDACDRDSALGFDPDFTPALARAMDAARRDGVPEAALQMALDYARQGAESVTLPKAGEEPAFPVRAALSLPDEFIERALTGHAFALRDAGKEVRHAAADAMWGRIVEAIWTSGEPMLSFRDSAGGFAERDCAASATGGLVFLPGTEAPAATINLAAFGADSGIVDCEQLEAATAVMAIALDAAFAFMQAGEKTLRYRPLCIGFTGLSRLLMASALAYDGEDGRNAAALLAALVSGAAHRASARIAASAGAFPDYAEAEKYCLHNIKDKLSAVCGTAFMQKGVTRRPVRLNPAQCADRALAAAVQRSWQEAYDTGREKGFRHAHVTAMDIDPALQALLGCRAPGIAPEKSVAGFECETGDGAACAKALNPAAARALEKLGYDAAAREDIRFYATGRGTLSGAPFINPRTLKARGFHQGALDAVEGALQSAQHIRYAFNQWTLGADFCARMLGFGEDALADPAFDMLQALGFSEDEIDAANIHCCGTMTLEGAPHLDVRHLPVFDCAAPPANGVRSVPPEAQVKMQAALEPFLSGAIVHTVELGRHATLDDVDRLALLGWELGVKQLRIYRDGCSLLHPVAPALPADEDDESFGAEEPLRAAS